MAYVASSQENEVANIRICTICSEHK